jgi:hypothetical protein
MRPDELSASLSPEDQFRKEINDIIGVWEFQAEPVSRDDFTYFVASFVSNHNLRDDFREKLQLWLSERDEWLSIDQAIENGG